MTKTRCEICNRNFNDEEALAMHNSAKHLQLGVKVKPLQKYFKNIKVSLFVVMTLGLLALGIYFMISNIETLPPIDMDGHIESNPAAHILKEPMAIVIQKHMLEHADGVEGGRGGVIINYNCKDYECEDGLIGKLEVFATKYDYVYVAPFKGMDAKIVLTKLNKRDILEDFDNERIEKFILH